MQHQALGHQHTFINAESSEFDPLLPHSSPRVPQIISLGSGVSASQPQRSIGKDTEGSAKVA